METLKDKYGNEIEFEETKKEVANELGNIIYKKNRCRRVEARV